MLTLNFLSFYTNLKLHLINLNHKSIKKKQKIQKHKQLHYSQRQETPLIF